MAHTRPPPTTPLITPHPATANVTNGHVTVSDMTSQDVLQPCISHIDFWPACESKALRACDTTYEPFDALVERANRWLQQFPQCVLVSVETVDKKVIYVKDIYSSSTYFTDEDGPILATHIKGLRLWYQPACPSPQPPITLAFTDVIPRYLNPGDKHPKFDTLPATIEKINTSLAEHPLPGRILSVETVLLKIAREDWSSTIQVNSRQCHWYDEYNTHQLAFLRIFYVCDSPAREAIGIHDFHPDTLDEGGIFHPAKYSPFSSLVKKAALWVQKNPSLRVTNIQTLDTKHRKKSENKGQRFNTDKVFEFRIEERFRAYYLRLGYAHCLEQQSHDHYFPLHTPKLTFREYLPMKKTNGYENITEMLQKVDDLVRRKDAKVLHVETVALPEWITKPGSGTRELGERTFYDGEWYFVPDADGNDRGPYRYTLLYVLRVYFDGLTESQFSRMRSISMTNTGNSCCVLL